MHTRIHAKIDDLEPDFRSWAEARIHRTLRRWQRRIASIRVFLQAQSGSRDTGAICRLVLQGQRGGGSIVAMGCAPDAEGALVEALVRARKQLRRRSDRPSANAALRARRRELCRAA